MKETNNIAAVYVRVSTLKDSQRDSPENQKAVCFQKADMEDLEIRPEFVYEDRSSATTIMNRPEIQQLVKDAQLGRFSTVIFVSLSRLTRDGLDGLSLKRKLVNAIGVRVISIEDVYDSKVSDNELMFQIITAVNQKLSEQISIASRRGIRESANRGNFTGSKAPFGYKKVKITLSDDTERKTLEVVEEEARIVQMIFHLYVHEKMGEKRVTNYLNEVEKIPSPKGGVWGITTIQRILQNEVYTGRNVHNKYTVKKVYNDIDDLQNRQNRLVQRDKSKWIRNEKKEWDAIIDDDLFQKAQEVRLQRGGGKRGGIRNVQVNPFAGLLKCEHCGSNFVSMKSGRVGKNGQEYRYLICSSRRRMGVQGCRNDLWIALEDFKEDVMKKLTIELERLISIEEVAASVQIQTTRNEKDTEKRKKQLEHAIKQKRALLMKLRGDFEIGEIDIDEEQYLYEKEAYGKQINELKNKLNELNETKDQTDYEEAVKEQVRDGLRKLVRLEFSTIDELQLILKQLIEEITVNSDGEAKIYTPLGTL